MIYYYDGSRKGEILQEWDLVHMLDSARYGMTDYDLTSDPFAQSASNWAHNNGIVEWGDDYLATARYQGIFKFNKAGGIEWIISPHGYWRDKYLKLLLNPLHADGTPITDPEVIAGTKNCDDLNGLGDVIQLSHYLMDTFFISIMVMGVTSNWILQTGKYLYLRHRI